MSPRENHYHLYTPVHCRIERRWDRSLSALASKKRLHRLDRAMPCSAIREQDEGSVISRNNLLNGRTGLLNARTARRALDRSVMFSLDGCSEICRPVKIRTATGYPCEVIYPRFCKTCGECGEHCIYNQRRLVLTDTDQPLTLVRSCIRSDGPLRTPMGRPEQIQLPLPDCVQYRAKRCVNKHGVWYL